MRWVVHPDKAQLTTARTKNQPHPGRLSCLHIGQLFKLTEVTRICTGGLHCFLHFFQNNFCGTLCIIVQALCRMSTSITLYELSQCLTYTSFSSSADVYPSFLPFTLPVRPHCLPINLSTNIKVFCNFSKINIVVSVTSFHVRYFRCITRLSLLIVWCIMPAVPQSKLLNMIVCLAVGSFLTLY